MVQKLQSTAVSFQVAHLKPIKGGPGHVGIGDVSPDMQWAVHVDVFGPVDVYDLKSKTLFATTKIEVSCPQCLQWRMGDCREEGQDWSQGQRVLLSSGFVLTRVAPWLQILGCVR